MQAIDLYNRLEPYLTDGERQISESCLESVCRYKQGKKTCRYLSLWPKGFVCMKNTIMKKIIDDKVKRNLWKSQGDNCSGLGIFKK